MKAMRGQAKQEKLDKISMENHDKKEQIRATQQERQDSYLSRITMQSII